MKQTISMIMLGAMIAQSAYAQKVKVDPQTIAATKFPIMILMGNQQYSITYNESPDNAKYNVVPSPACFDLLAYSWSLIQGMKFNKVSTAENSLNITVDVSRLDIGTKELVRGTDPSGQKPALSYKIKANYSFHVLARLGSGETVIDLMRNQGSISYLNYPGNLNNAGSEPPMYATEANLKSALDGNMVDVLSNIRHQCCTDFIAFFKDTINSAFGYSYDKIIFNIATVKSKSFNYDDLDSAKALLYQAMDSVTSRTKRGMKQNWSFSSSQTLVKQAVVIWERALSQAASDDKARINPEIAAYIRFNLAYAYLMLDEYDKAIANFKRSASDSNLDKTVRRQSQYMLDTYVYSYQRRYAVHKERLAAVAK